MYLLTSIRKKEKVKLLYHSNLGTHNLEWRNSLKGYCIFTSFNYIFARFLNHFEIVNEPHV